MPPSECEDLNNTEVLTELCINLGEKRHLFKIIENIYDCNLIYHSMS